MTSERQSAFAPGRVELLGNHTDYNEGRVLAAALDLGVTIEGERLDDSIIEVTSRDFGRTARVGIDRISADEAEPWASYLIGVASVFSEAGHPVGGFRASFSSSIPVGAGLSSSAALEVATGMLLQKLFGFTLAPLDLAKLCRRAENRFVGVNCGLLDQATSVFGRRDHAVLLDCREETVENIPMPRDHQLLIVNTNVEHALTGGEYNERRESCFKAARRLGVAALRDVSPPQLEAHADQLEQPLLKRARHVVGECERVELGARALSAGDLARFGELMFQSHASSVANFENSTPELDALVEIARQTPGVVGSRLTGGGFGGATVSLVASEALDDAREAMLAAYRERVGHEASALACRVSDGAS